jgi:hypothetical protein
MPASSCSLLKSQVRSLACRCLASLAMLRGGRDAVVGADGIASLVSALTKSPGPAAHALSVRVNLRNAKWRPCVAAQIHMHGNSDLCYRLHGSLP